VAPPKKKRHVFRWVFLAAQVLFLIWIITGLATTAHPSHCGSLDTQTCRSASDVGRTIGVGLVVFFWVAFDIIVGGTYAVWKLVSRKNS
jgi:hypothetical protein